MNHLLDNMIWNALVTGNKDIAVSSGAAGCYRPDIAPFAAVEELNNDNLGQLHALLPAERKVALSWFDRPALNPEQWQVLHEMDCSQMVYEYPVKNFETKESRLVVPLTREHVPQMLELTAMTKPGPFLENTILFGNYFGVLVDGQLAAMAGQRMHPVPYMEVSAVCTHPAFRGKGYARACMLQVMKLITENGFTPFLHVLTSNTTAIQLYESIGYRIRKRIFINVIKRL